LAWLFLRSLNLLTHSLLSVSKITGHVRDLMFFWSVSEAFPFLFWLELEVRQAHLFPRLLVVAYVLLALRLLHHLRDKRFLLMKQGLVLPPGLLFM
jgi:apolipoprotein N-acyltransferase